MKKLYLYSLMAMLILAVALSGCGGGGSGTPTPPLSPTPTPINYPPGQSSTYTVGSGASAISFKMNYAPSGSFASDDNTVTGDPNLPATVNVTNAYWIAQTEVTYQLWSAVYTWAITTATNKYTFADTGTEGSSGIGSNLQPVNTISWRDAMVWCNALTEYYNATNGTSLACVYTYNGSIVRDSTNATACDNVTAVSTAKGFRLPMSNEWELAARYQDGTNWTPGDHVSGDTSGYCYNSGISTTASTIFGNYAWYSGNCSSTQPVGQKTANALGLYDMCGNIYQWCFDWYPGFSGSFRVGRGGSWNCSTLYLQIGYIYFTGPGSGVSGLGFRPVKTQ